MGSSYDDSKKRYEDGPKGKARRQKYAQKPEVREMRRGYGRKYREKNADAYRTRQRDLMRERRSQANADLGPWGAYSFHQIAKACKVCGLPYRREAPGNRWLPKAELVKGLKNAEIQPPSNEEDFDVWIVERSQAAKEGARRSQAAKEGARRSAA